MVTKVMQQEFPIIRQNKRARKCRSMEFEGKDPGRVAKDEMTNLETNFTDTLGSLHSYILFIMYVCRKRN
jgi:hypothetical protein